MPTVTGNDVLMGYGSCTDSLCPGYTQQPAEIRRTETSFTFAELGGDLPGYERSIIREQFADQDRDGSCAVCGKPRIASLEERPEYPNTSGQDPLRLRNMTQDSKIRDMEMDALRRDREMAEMRATIAELQARPRGPGRPRKEDGE